MNRRGVTLAIPLAIVILSLAGSGDVHAGVVLGTSLGYTHTSYPDQSDVTDDNFALGRPGIRLGYLSPGGRWDLNADINFVYDKYKVGGNSATGTSVEVLPQVQANLPGPRGFVPFVNGGLGIDHETLDLGVSISETRPAYGAGIGVRKPVSDDHGILRVEIRYDHLPKVSKELSPSSGFTFPATDMVSLKLGFDLVLRR